MDILTIDGGGRLNGDIVISGSKNAALPILIATLLTDEACLIRNVPNLDDIETVIALLVFLGKKITRQNDAVEVAAGPTLYAEAPYELVRKMRASIVVMGPLLARLGHVKASLPGGCAIGGRPINIHLDGFRSLGASIRLDQGYVDVSSLHLSGAAIRLNFPSVGATENLMMAAALIPGRTEIGNAAMEPEITDLARFLNAMGARIEGAGTDRIKIDGVKSLRGVEHTVIADRIEAGTYMIASAITRGDVVLRGAPADFLQSLIVTLRQANTVVELEQRGVRVSCTGPIHPVNIETAVYPGFPTDLQAQWMALMALADGTSHITERVFENRFMHVPELQRMGARVEIRENTAIIQGMDHLSGAPVMVSDLRAGAALVLAGLAASGTTVIRRIYHLDRGYENLATKLQSLGAKIHRSAE